MEATYPGHWIGRRNATEWLALSPDKTPLLSSFFVLTFNNKSINKINPDSLNEWSLSRFWQPRAVSQWKFIREWDLYMTTTVILIREWLKGAEDLPLQDLIRYQHQCNAFWPDCCRCCWCYNYKQESKRQSRQWRQLRRLKMPV